MTIRFLSTMLFCVGGGALRLAIRKGQTMERQPCALFMGARSNYPHLSDAEVWALIDAVPDRAPKQRGGARHARGSRPAKPEHVERRRRWAASGKMPANLAHRFTPAEQAALAVIAHEVKAKGDCRKSNAEIGDMAGVSQSTVKSAIREAKALGFLRVEERRVNRWRNQTNVVSIVSPEWRTWLRLGGGVKTATPLKTNILYKKMSPASCPQNAGLVRHEEEGRKPRALTIALSHASVEVRGLIESP